MCCAARSCRASAPRSSPRARPSTCALARAARALVAHEKRSLRRAGAEGARKKVVVETLNGRSILDSPLAEVLQDAGLVRLPDGMRLYVSPF